MAKKTTDYAALASKEEKLDAIASTKKEADLDAMWAAWEERGWTRDGQMYAAVLARKQELGVKLSEGDVERIELAEQQRQAGAALPPISGRLGR